MPRNDQVTRQWLLLQKLEGARGATLEELSGSLPQDLVRNPRTIRRDLEALELRFPLIVDRVQGQTRWRLMDGYRHLPPLAFSTQMPLGFDIEAYVRDALITMRGKPVQVELQFDRPTAAWVRDQIWHSSQQLTMLKGGRLKLSLEVGDTQELLGWILHFGAGVQVVKPESLKDKVREEAEKIFSQL